MFEREFGPKSTWTEPDDVLELSADTTLTIAGMTMGTHPRAGAHRRVR